MCRKQKMVKRSGKKVKDYSVAHAKVYNTALKDMIARRMRSSILEVGSFWFSAWVDAGQRDLSRLIKQPLSMDEKRKIQHEGALYKAGKVLALKMH